MKENMCDYINKYLNGQIKGDDPIVIRTLIGDFAILWNQYERTIYKKNHRIGMIKKKIKKWHLDRINSIDSLYLRLKKYIEHRGYHFSKEDIRERFNIDNKISDDDINSMITGNTNFDKVYCLLVIAARVRNNMFHGDKGAWELQEQKELFMICSELLMGVLEITNMKYQ